MSTQSYFRPRAMSEDGANAEALLYRYPRINSEELSSLLKTFANLPLLDFGVLAADERMGRKLDQFYADHGDKLRPPLFGVTWMIAVPFLILILALLYGVGG